MDVLAPPSVPHAVEVEQALLGAILMNNEAYHRVAPFLKPQHFYDPLHARLYDLCAKRIGAGHLVDARTLKGFINAEEPVGDMNAGQYVARLAFEAATIINSEDYGRTLLDLAVRRELIGIAMDAEHDARDAPPDMPAGKLLEEIQGRFAEISTYTRIEGVELNLNGAAQIAVNLAGEAYKHQRPIGWPWCLPELADVVDGPLEPSNLYGLLGASGDGKTSLTLQQLRFLAEQGVPCLFLSGEQSQAQCMWQMTAQSLGIEATRIKKGGLSEDEFDRFYEDQRNLAKLPFSIQKWANLTVAQLGIRVRAFVKRYGPGVIAIDHAKKITWRDARGMFAEQIFQTYGELKDMMADVGCAGIILQQRNSEFLKRRQMRPVRGDVYGGEGALQNLDACFAVYRPDRWLNERAKIAERQSEKESQESERDRLKGFADLYGLKARAGEDERDQRVRFVARLTRFETLRDKQDERLL